MPVISSAKPAAARGGPTRLTSTSQQSKLRVKTAPAPEANPQSTALSSGHSHIGDQSAITLGFSKTSAKDSNGRLHLSGPSHPKNTADLLTTGVDDASTTLLPNVISSGAPHSTSTRMTSTANSSTTSTMAPGGPPRGPSWQYTAQPSRKGSHDRPLSAEASVVSASAPLTVSSTPAAAELLIRVHTVSTAAAAAPHQPVEPPPQRPFRSRFLSGEHPGIARCPNSPFHVSAPTSRKGLQPELSRQSDSGQLLGNPSRGKSAEQRETGSRLYSAYRYPPPPQVSDQLYMHEGAVVRLCGLPNLTLTTKTHYAASPFVYTPSGAHPNHTTPMYFPTAGQRCETNTAAGRLLTPAGRGKASDGFVRVGKKLGGVSPSRAASTHHCVLKPAVPPEAAPPRLARPSCNDTQDLLRSDAEEKKGSAPERRSAGETISDASRPPRAVNDETQLLQQNQASAAMLSNSKVQDEEDESGKLRVVVPQLGASTATSIFREPAVLTHSGERGTSSSGVRPDLTATGATIAVPRPTSPTASRSPSASALTRRTKDSPSPNTLRGSSARNTSEGSTSVPSDVEVDGAEPPPRRPATATTAGEEEERDAAAPPCVTPQTEEAHAGEGEGKVVAAPAEKTAAEGSNDSEEPRGVPQQKPNSATRLLSTGSSSGGFLQREAGSRRAQSRGAGDASQGSDYGPSVSLVPPPDSRVSRGAVRQSGGGVPFHSPGHRSSSGSGMKPVGNYPVLCRHVPPRQKLLREDPRETEPLSRSLKWRFLTSTAVSVRSGHGERRVQTTGATKKRLRSAPSTSGASSSPTPDPLAHTPDLLHMSWEGTQESYTVGDTAAPSASLALNGSGAEELWTGPRPHDGSPASSASQLLLLHPLATAGSTFHFAEAQKAGCAPPVDGVFSFGMGGGLHRTPSGPTSAAGEMKASPNPALIEEDDAAPLPTGRTTPPPSTVNRGRAAAEFPVQPSERIGPELHKEQPKWLQREVEEEEAAAVAANLTEQIRSHHTSTDSVPAVLSSPPLALASTASDFGTASTQPGTPRSTAEVQAELAKIPITAYHTSTAPASHTLPIVPAPQALPVYLLSAMDRAKRTMTLSGNLCPRPHSSHQSEYPLIEQQRMENQKAVSGSTSARRERGQERNPNTFSLTLPRNQFKPRSQRQSSSPSSAPTCGHIQRKQMREAQIDARIQQFRSDVQNPLSVDEQERPEVEEQCVTELHVTRTLHKNDPTEKPSEKEAQFLWQESKIRPMPLMVAQSPMEHIPASSPNAMLLQQTQVSEPPYAAAEAARLAAQRHVLSRMEYEEKMQPFRIATTLLTNTNARHLELLDIQHKCKERDQWLVQRVEEYFPEDMEDENEQHSTSFTGTVRATGESSAGTGAAASDGAAASESNPSGELRAPGHSSTSAPRRIPKTFPPAFRALLEEMQSASPVPESSRATRHKRHQSHKHRSLGGVEEAGDSLRSPSPTFTPTRAVSRSSGSPGIENRRRSAPSLRSQSSRVGLRRGHHSFDGPKMMHNPHLDRLRAALVATDSELDVLLQPPGWPKSRLSVHSSATPATTGAFEQYRKAIGGSSQTSHLGDDEVPELVNPEKRRLDEISALFLRLLEEAADAAHYAAEDRERIVDIHAAFQEQRLQQEYQNHHPLLDVAVSLAFDEQWAAEVERHKSKKDRKSEATKAVAAAAGKKIVANAKANAAVTDSGSDKTSRAKGRKGGHSGAGTTASPHSEDPASVSASKQTYSGASGIEMLHGGALNPLFPMNRAWSRETERLQQHEGLLDLLRHRPLEDFPGLLRASEAGVSNASITSVEAEVVSGSVGCSTAEQRSDAGQGSGSLPSVDFPPKPEDSPSQESTVAEEAVSLSRKSSRAAESKNPAPETAGNPATRRKSSVVIVADPDDPRASAASEASAMKQRASVGSASEARSQLATEAVDGEAAKARVPPPPLHLGASVMDAAPRDGGRLPRSRSVGSVSGADLTDVWAVVRDMGVTVPVSSSDPHMRLLLEHHENAVAEMEMLMNAEEVSVSNLLQQFSDN